VGGNLGDYLTTTDTGMAILAAPQDPVEMGRVGSAGYLAVDHLLARYHDIVIYDCGTGFLDEITQCALAQADQIILVAAPQLVTAKIIVSAVAHLETTGFDLERATLVLNMTRRADRVDSERLRAALLERITSIVEVPYDARLARDLDLGSFQYSKLTATTRLALKRLAAEVAGRLASGQTELVGSR
jgi:MinD-like ATPase involved in chromosome partitioning or flagellar assembly